MGIDYGLAFALERVRTRIERAAARSGRTADAIRLIAITKGHPTAAVCAAIEAGIEDLGENYVQPWRAKVDELAELVAGGLDSHRVLRTRWHLVGALQRNKVRQVVGRVALIHSVDRPGLLEEVARRAEEQGLVQDILLQVKLVDEANKAGAIPEKVPELYQRALELPSLSVRGLMAIPPPAQEPERMRPWFRQTRQLLAELLAYTPLDRHRPSELSMGMSHDLEVAIEEGATMVRVGTDLFGPRKA